MSCDMRQYMGILNTPVPDENNGDSDDDDDGGGGGGKSNPQLQVCGWLCTAL